MSNGLISLATTNKKASPQPTGSYINFRHKNITKNIIKNQQGKLRKIVIMAFISIFPNNFQHKFGENRTKHSRT